ncbi:uncharacterized protein LY89DRAFT_91678 [Mollisia scopiformis]|uniref:SAP domain-containing protein n=1 Tax=Mollisia scopiformis TaxID=149040 RepID=A0A194X783_MOLSC|nr:uncharacterized protein LY89DRAFT_91678 [Mollisia scopiformis]KUJ15677.1 hypothetical protein LY89DRAFT_91678 [Mollisia scopiformis]
MSRVTPPVTKLTHAVRRISTSSKAARPSTLLESSRSSRYLPRNTKALKEECKKRQLNSTGNKAELVDRLAAHDMLSTHRDYHSMSSGHRPTTPSVPVYHTIPLMQGFQTSAPKQAINDMSTIDFFFFPEIPADPPLNPFAKLRVPLLPDNYNPDRSPGTPHAIETIDEALPRPEIHIVASHPEDVMPATISEVVGNDGLDIDLASLTKNFSSTAIKELKEKSLVGELWSGIVDDVLGPKSRKVAV